MRAELEKKMRFSVKVAICLSVVAFALAATAARVLAQAPLLCPAQVDHSSELRNAASGQSHLHP